MFKQGDKNKAHSMDNKVRHKVTKLESIHFKMRPSVGPVPDATRIAPNAVKPEMRTAHLVCAFCI